jgi:hypothetical protein
LRLFGAQPYREIGNAVHNRKTLTAALKNPTTVDRNAVALTRMRLRFAAQPLPSRPSTYLTDAELKCLDTEPSATTSPGNHSFSSRRGPHQEICVWCTDGQRTL